MIEVEVGDAVVEFPDGTPHETIKKALATHFPPPAPKKGLVEALASAWENPAAGGLMSMVKPVVEGVRNLTQTPVVAPGLRREDFTDAPPPSRGDVAGRPGLLPQGMLAPVAAQPNDQILESAVPVAGAVMLSGTGAPAGALASGLARPRSAVPGVAPVAEKAAQGGLLESAENIGVGIPKFLASDNMATQRAAAAVRHIPGAGDKIVKATEGVASGLGKAADDVAEAFGTGSPAVAGSYAKDALADWITGGSKAATARVYDAVDKLVKPEVTRELEATRGTIAEIMGRRAASKISGESPAVREVLEAVQTPGGLNYEGIKGLRTYIGEMTPQELVAKGIKKQEADAIYGALTQDLKSTIKDAGGLEALNAFEKANRVAATTFDRKAQIEKIIGVKGDAAPEAVFARLTAMAGSKSSADISRLMTARKVMGPEAWNEVASAAVAKLGRDAQGNFSYDRFHTAFGNLSEAGKRALFKSTGKDDLARSLQDINTVVNALKQKVGKFANPSGTAQNVMGATTITGMVSSPISTIAGLIGGNALAAALAKPATARAIADFTKTYERASRNPSGIPVSLMRVAAQNLANTLAANGIPTNQ